MPVTTVRGLLTNYEVLGESGPWVALSPGGRRGFEGVESVARRLAAEGYRVLLHDRRNCGSSDVGFDGSASEFEHLADDLDDLLGQLGARPAWVGGASSGCRLSVLLAKRHPETVRGLLLWRVTGGVKAATSLAQQYYGLFIEAAEEGGMEAVSATEHFRDRIAARPENRDRLLSIEPEQFIEVMTSWREGLLAEGELPMLGATEEELRAIAVPTLVIPGADEQHLPAVGERVHELVPVSELHVLTPVPEGTVASLDDERAAQEPELVATFVDFIQRHSADA